MRNVLIAMSFVVVAMCQHIEVDIRFIPKEEGGNLVEQVQGQMEHFNSVFAKIVNTGDHSVPMKRSEVHHKQHPASRLEMIKRKVKQSFSGVRQMFKQKAQRIRHQLKKKMRALKQGLPEWTNLREGPMRIMQKRMKQLWFRKTLKEQCPEAAKMCPEIKCPKRLSKCLKKIDVSDSCGAFLNSVDAFLVKKKDIKKQYQTAKKSCKKLSHQKRKECKRIAKATKRLQKGKLEEDLSSAMEARSATMTVQKKSAGVQFVETKMTELKDFVEGVPEAEQAEAKTETTPELAEAAGCKTDNDCHAGGDMGGYCKANGDCHCSAPYFASSGTTCSLSCSPTSATPCCRDDADCQAGGDKGAYCKSPKSTFHTTPGNAMCRCSADFKGTTSCEKASEDMVEGAMDDMDEGPPHWISGDTEAPAGEKDMGGWTMRAYTPEQQARLQVDEMGEPAKAPNNDFAAKPAASTHIFVGLLSLLGCLILMLGITAKQRSRQYGQLSAVYDQAAMGPHTVEFGSQNQI